MGARRHSTLGPEWVLIGFLWFCYMLNHADRQVVYTLFPALQKDLGISNAALGLTGALFLWVYGLVSPLSGMLGDRWPKTKLVVSSLAIWSAFTILTGFSPGIVYLLTCRALLGISESVFMPAAYGLMANAHPPESRSKAIAIFGTSQLVGVALGGSLSGYVAEQFHWRVSFWLLGAIGVLFAIPLAMFFRTIPASFHGSGVSGAAAAFRGFLSLFRIPSLRVVTFFVSIATFGLYLVYTWLPTFLYDKFSLGLAHAGFEASVYPQIGSALGLLVGGAAADIYYRRNHAARFWVILTACFGAAPCIFLIGYSPTLEATRLASIGFGFFSGFIAGNQAAAAFDVVPASLRASTVGVLNLLGATISGFAPFLGGLARQTVGVDRLMTLAAVMYAITGFVVLYGILVPFARDHKRVQESLNQ
ncbi:MAG: MFS transporter [Bryobacterales bacterium]|nr:MFS transporter [Bryobacterales bacterium]